MATPAASVQTVHLDILTNYLVSMARTVELAVDRASSALLQAGSPESRQAPGEIFLLEPRVNEMEMVIDEHAVRMLRSGSLSSEEIRQVVATLKITNDLERMGDLAVIPPNGLSPWPRCTPSPRRPSWNRWWRR